MLIPEKPKGQFLLAHLSLGAVDRPAMFDMKDILIQ